MALFQLRRAMNGHDFIQRWFRGRAIILLAGLLIPGVYATSGNETDNFCLPLDKELADLGPFLEAVHTIALQETVAEVNARIEKALLFKDESARTTRLQGLHDPQVLSKVFRERFSHPLLEDKQLEHALRGAWARQTYAGQSSLHKDLRMYFVARFPLDPRRYTILTQSGTIKAFGVYFGTDKLVHFHHLGADYYWMYLDLLQHGLSKEDAYRKVLEYFTAGGIWSEKALFGELTTGVYSHADLAANHVGFKFLVNLTEKVVLKGEEREPLLVRSGVFWRLNRQVRPRSGWFSAFISDHWNEALNPNRYDASMRPAIRRFLERQAQNIVSFYTQIDGRPEDPAYFDNLACELSTYYGEPYGHGGPIEALMTIGNTIIPALRAHGSIPKH